MPSSEALTQFAQIYDWIPEEWREARQLLIEAVRQAAETANYSVRGMYSTSETVSGKLWTPKARSGLNEPIVNRNVLRKIIDVGPLNDFTATNPQTVAHGITTTANTFITALYGAASDPGASTLTLGIPLPYLDISGLSACIGLSIDSTNIILTSGTDYSAYTKAWVVVEYVQEA